MCKDLEYNVFPSISIGGPPGLYKIRCPIPSKDNADFCVVACSNAAGTAATILVSGTDQPPATFDTTGATTYDELSFQRFQVFQVPVNNSVSLQEYWERITSPEGYVFIRILASTASFVTLKWREKILRAIPAPATTVDPNNPQQYHYARSKKIQQMVLGKEGEIEEYAKEPGKPFGVRSY